MSLPRSVQTSDLVGKIHFVCLSRHFCREQHFFPSFNNTYQKERKEKKYSFVVTAVVSSFPSSSHFSWVTFSPSGRYKNQIANAKHSLRTQITRILRTPWPMLGCLNITCHLMQLSFNERSRKKCGEKNYTATSTYFESSTCIFKMKQNSSEKEWKRIEHNYAVTKMLWQQCKVSED